MYPTVVSCRYKGRKLVTMIRKTTMHAWERDQLDLSQNMCARSKSHGYLLNSSIYVNIPSYKNRLFREGGGRTRRIQDRRCRSGWMLFLSLAKINERKRRLCDSVSNRQVVAGPLYMKRATTAPKTAAMLTLFMAAPATGMAGVVWAGGGATGAVVDTAGGWTG